MPDNSFTRLFSKIDHFLWPVLAVITVLLATTSLVMGAQTINRSQERTPISISYPEGYLDLPSDSVATSSDLADISDENTVKTDIPKLPTKKKTTKSAKTKTSSKKSKKPSKPAPA